MALEAIFFSKNSYRVIEGLESKASGLKKENTEIRENLNRVKLERDVSLQEKCVTGKTCYLSLYFWIKFNDSDLNCSRRIKSIRNTKSRIRTWNK